MSWRRIALCCALGWPALPVQAQTQMLHRCVGDGGAVAILSVPCPPGTTETWVRTIAPEPEQPARAAATPPSRAQRPSAQPGARRSTARRAAGRGKDVHARCSRARDRAARRREREWLTLTIAQRRRLDSWVREQCEPPRG